MTRTAAPTCGKITPAFLLLIAVFFSHSAAAAIDNAGILNNVTDRFYSTASSWGSIILSHATWLFWILGTISLTWTMGMLALKKADLGEFFAEFVRFIIFFGFFLWLLRNGPVFAKSIIDSLVLIGSEATGSGITSPSGIMDAGFSIFFKVLDNTTVWSPATSMIGALLGGIALIVIALIAANMTILFCSAWVLLYGGVFFLGFGGSRWTSDIAINYYKAILSVSASLLAMVLIIGIATSIINEYYQAMSGSINIKELACILVVSIILLLLVDRIPGIVAAIVTGSSVVGGLGTFGAGTAVGAAGLAVAAATTGSTTALAGVQSAAGGASAVRAAFQSAQEHMATGTGLFARNHPSETGSAAGISRLAQAMGTGALFAADMGSNFAKGATSVAKDQTGNLMASFKREIGGTVGGKIASSIKSQGGVGESTNSRGDDRNPSFAGDSLGAGKNDVANSSGVTGSEAANPEVQAFVNKNS